MVPLVDVNAPLVISKPSYTRSDQYHRSSNNTVNYHFIKYIQALLNTRHRLLVIFSEASCLKGESIIELKRQFKNFNRTPASILIEIWTAVDFRFH